MTAYGDRGKWAEKQAQKWLDARMASEKGFAYHRYPDARSAQGALGKQPADYIVGRKMVGFLPMGNSYGQATHLEVKETKEANRLPKDKIGQYGKLKLFSMAGFRTRVLVYRSAHDDWVFFTDDDIFGYEVCPPSFPFKGLESFSSAAAALERIFA